jgi:hypothetical protein
VQKRQKFRAGKSGLAYGWLDGGVMIGPGFFQAMSESFDGLNALTTKYKETGCRRADTTHQPNDLFHVSTPQEVLNGSITLVGCWMHAKASASCEVSAMLRGYTCGMDRVRFGRALGYGARHAAKTLMAAADAAASPSSSATGKTAPRAGGSSTQARPTASAAPRPVTVSAARVAAVSTQASATGRNMVSSVKRFSRTVMLQVMGTFFAMFALTFAGAVWRMHAAFHLPTDTPEAHKLYAAVLMFVVFTYFTASSFLRARKLEKM